MLLLLPSLSRPEGNGRNRKGGGETGPRRGVALICLDTNLFPRQTQPLELDDGPPSLLPPSRGIVIPLCYVIDAVPVVTNRNSRSLIICLVKRDRFVTVGDIFQRILGWIEDNRAQCGRRLIILFLRIFEIGNFRNFGRDYSSSAKFIRVCEEISASEILDIYSIRKFADLLGYEEISSRIFFPFEG